MNVFAVRAAELTEDRSEPAAAVDPLLKAREAVERQIGDLDRKVMRLPRNDAQVRRFMTTPGVGAIHSSLLPGHDRRRRRSPNPRNTPTEFPRSCGR